MEQIRREVADDSLEKLREYRQAGNNGRAFAHYLIYLELMPEERENHCKPFTDILFDWCSSLELEAKTENVCRCYSQAINYFPKNVEILNSFASFLLRGQAALEAKVYLNAALKIDKQYLPALSNLNTANQQLVERWHFRMLNDLKRNNAYNVAIQKTIDTTYNKVLDIGTGSGFLSLCASKNPNTVDIKAVEQSQALSVVAEEIFTKNSCNVKVHHAVSTELKDVGLSNVLITEIFDTALFGEHCLETLIDAHERLLEPDCKLIPASAKVFIAGFESLDLIKTHKVSTNHRFFKDLCIIENHTEPYDAYHIANFNHKLLTEPVELVDVDFSNLQQLRSLYLNANSIPKLHLRFTDSGTLHGFVIWFTLRLSENVAITTNPFSENCGCWEQAIVFLDHFPTISLGDTLEVEASCTSDKLRILTPGIVKEDCVCYYVSRELVAFLNDSKLMQVLDNVSLDCSNSEELYVLDLYPFPIIGLNLVLQSNATVLTSMADENILRRICDNLNCNFDKFIIVPEEDLLRTLREFRKAFDVIAFDPVTNNGTINEDFFSNYALYAEALKESGMFIPMDLSLDFQLIQSDYLLTCNQVDDENVLGFKIAEFINKFKALELWDVQEDSFAYKALSKVYNCEVQYDSTSSISKELTIKKNQPGRVDGALYWFRIHYPGNLDINTKHTRYYSNVISIFDGALRQDLDATKVKIVQDKGLLSILL